MSFGFFPLSCLDACARPVLCFLFYFLASPMPRAKGETALVKYDNDSCGATRIVLLQRTSTPEEDNTSALIIHQSCAVQGLAPSLPLQLAPWGYCHLYADATNPSHRSSRAIPLLCLDVPADKTKAEGACTRGNGVGGGT